MAVHLSTQGLAVNKNNFASSLGQVHKALPHTTQLGLCYTAHPSSLDMCVCVLYKHCTLTDICYIAQNK